MFLPLGSPVPPQLMGSSTGSEVECSLTGVGLEEVVPPSDARPPSDLQKAAWLFGQGAGGVSHLSLSSVQLCLSGSAPLAHARGGASSWRRPNLQDAGVTTCAKPTTAAAPTLMSTV